MAEAVDSNAPVGLSKCAVQRLPAPPHTPGGRAASGIRAVPPPTDGVDTAPNCRPEHSSLRRLQNSSRPPECKKPSWLPAGGPRFGDYELLGRLAQGGMAEVYLARHHTQGPSRLVAMKIACTTGHHGPAFARMFEAEARVAMQLSHPNIAHTYDYGLVDDTPFLVLEWIDGFTLTQVRRALWQHKDVVPVPFAVRIACDVLGALHYAHRSVDSDGTPLAIVHRDISPNNIMIRHDGTVKLLDFGIATAIDDSGDPTVMGNRGYLAPEQCLGQPLDERSDLFSTGVCLYEMLTGQPLFDGASNEACIRAILEEPIRPVHEVAPSVPRELSEIVGKALAKDPKERFQTASAMRDALEGFLSESGQLPRSRRGHEFMQQTFALQRAMGPTLERDTELMARGSAPIEDRPQTRRNSWLLVATLLALTIGVLLGTALYPAVVTSLLDGTYERATVRGIDAPVAAHHERSPGTSVEAPATNGSH